MKLSNEKIRDKKFCVEEYQVKKKSICQIRRENGFGINTIKRWFDFHEIPRRSCDDPIIQKQRMEAIRHLHIKRQRRNNGYLYVYFPEHPGAGISGYVSEHRMVASRMLGRELTKKDIVHHEDGDRWNNEETNLYPTTKPGHKKAHSSLMQIGYDLVKQGVVRLKSGEYQWM